MSTLFWLEIKLSRLEFFNFCRDQKTIDELFVFQLMECTKVYEKEVNVAYYILVFTPLLVVLGQFRKLKQIVPFSTVANVCLLTSFAIVFYYIFRTAMPPIKERPFFGHLETYPSYISIAVFSMENVGVVSVRVCPVVYL